jgi:hypothetical protein
MSSEHEPAADLSPARREAAIQARIEELRRQLERKRARRAERAAFFDGMAAPREHATPDPAAAPASTHAATPR